MGQIVTHHSAARGAGEMRDVIEHDHVGSRRPSSLVHPRRTRSLMEQHIERISREHFGALGGQLDDFIEWL